MRRKEAGNIFGGGSRTPIAITLLVKNPADKKEKATIHYHDIGDYLNREEKLGIVRKFATISNLQMQWKPLLPNEHGDWISQRNQVFEAYIPLECEKKNDLKSASFFVINSLGLTTGRDAWCVNFSGDNLTFNMKSMIGHYNSQVDSLFSRRKKTSELKLEEFINTDTKKISWSRGLKRSLENYVKIDFNNENITKFLYRPFTRQLTYYTKDLNEYVYQWSKFTPRLKPENIFICISSSGTTAGLSLLISNCMVDAHFNGDTQCFPLYYYEEQPKGSKGLFDGNDNNKYIRRDGVSDFILERAKKQYGKTVGKEDIFYYVYGFLHSPGYRATFANDLKKMLPRLPLVEDVRDFWAFSKAGRKLAELHIGYETVPAAPGVVVLFNTVPQEAINKAMQTGEMDYLDYRVEKMRFASKEDKSRILYNSQIMVDNIPARAYEYVVNGKSAIEWIMERYQITVHKDSGIKNDPNDWAKEVGKPRYILDLLLSIINVSIQTVEIVEGLPKTAFQ